MKKVWVAGHNGMVGSSIYRNLKASGLVKIITISKSRLNLLDQNAVLRFLKEKKPDEVILAAAKVGGIHANNSYPANFIFENLQIELNIIHCSHLCDVQKLLFLGSSCIYPRDAVQPICEKELLSGKLEKTNEPYAIAKIAGIKMCESYNRQYNRDYRSLMPTNLYGPGDNFNFPNSHVIPALIRKIHEAKINNKKQVVIWGSGKPLREFLYVDDLARASLFIHNLDEKVYKLATDDMLSHINVGSGDELSIKQLAHLLKITVNYDGDLFFDINQPDGTPRKLLDSSKLISLGWKRSVELEIGLKWTYSWFLKNLHKFN